VIPSVTIECAECRQRLLIIESRIEQFKDSTSEPPTVELPPIPEGSDLVEADETDPTKVRCSKCGHVNDVTLPA
jgi:DNA-directed RNA polymerase subunit RPC12/RpoP